MERAFATIEDLELLWRDLNIDEVNRAKALLSVVSDTLRLEAKKAKIDLDEKSQEDEAYKTVLTSVVIDIVARTLMTSTNSEPMVQESQSALGYTWSGTYLTPGGGLFIKKAELDKLGIGKRQRVWGWEPYGKIEGHNNYFN